MNLVNIARAMSASLLSGGRSDVTPADLSPEMRKQIAADRRRFKRRRRLWLTRNRWTAPVLSSKQIPGRTSQKVTLSDRTVYRVWTDGSWRRDVHPDTKWCAARIARRRSLRAQA